MVGRRKKAVKKTMRRRRAVKGGALTDWIPGGDYLASAYNYYTGTTPESNLPANLIESTVIDNPEPSKASSTGSLLGTLRKIKPVTYIDNALHELGLRKTVRRSLKKNALGRMLVSGADTARQLGFGDRAVMQGQAGAVRAQTGGNYIISDRARKKLIRT